MLLQHKLDFLNYTSLLLMALYLGSPKSRYQVVQFSLGLLPHFRERKIEVEMTERERQTDTERVSSIFFT